MKDDTRAVAQALIGYAQHKDDDGVGTVETLFQFEQATAVLRENDVRYRPGRYDPLADYENVLQAAATALDHLAEALSTATSRSRAEIYTDLREHINGLPTGLGL